MSLYFYAKRFDDRKVKITQKSGKCESVLTLHNRTRIQLVWAQGLCSYGASRFFIMATRLEANRPTEIPQLLNTLHTTSQL